MDGIAEDPRVASPTGQGFSPRNLKCMRRFAEAWPDRAMVQQLLHDYLAFHPCALLDMLNHPTQRECYLHASIQCGWSQRARNASQVAGPAGNQR